MRLPIAVMMVLLFASLAFPAPITVMCDAPTDRVDGSPLGLNEITKYTVYWGSTSPPTNKVEFPISTALPSLSTMTLLMTGPVGTYYFGGTVTDQYGQESGMSVIIQRFVKPAKPSPHGAYK